MSATDELRRLLDERGVEWRKTPHYSSESQDNETIFEGNEIEWYANDHLNGRLGLRALRYEVTPAQAIDATLGRGTCHDLAETPDYRYKTQFECSECGYEYSSVGGFGCDYGDEPDFRYCPNCGRRVIGDVDAN